MNPPIDPRSQKSPQNKPTASAGGSAATGGSRPAGTPAAVGGSPAAATPSAPAKAEKPAKPGKPAKARTPKRALDANGLRWTVYWMLIVVSTGGILGRILAVDSVDRGSRADAHRPFLSANDRSRWATVRALVEDEMRVDGAPYAIDKVIQEPNWDTIDMVKHGDHLYSSKPPLLPTLMAGVYWPIYRLGGVSLGNHPYEIGRVMLVLFNAAPLLIYFLLVAALVDRFGTTDWGRIFVVAAATFGTLLGAFAISINNHLPAAVCVAAAVYATVRIWFDGERRWRFFIVAGLFGGLAVTNEFPAAALLALLGAVWLWKSPKKALLGSLPAVLLVAGAFFGANWIAHRSLKPAYMHRSGDDNWYRYTFEYQGHEVQSYWENPRGIDRGEPSANLYAVNVLVGHHGIFSLTPVWLLSVLGMGIWIWRRHDPRLRWSTGAVVLVSAVVLMFYLMLPLVCSWLSYIFGPTLASVPPPETRNYGGMTAGMRWAFWLAPLWLLAMVPAADALSTRRWTRGLALVLLAFSVLSASFPTWNPWTHPWLMVFSYYAGWGW